MVEMILIWLVAPTLLLLLSYSIGLGLSVLLRKPLNFSVATILGFSAIVIFGSLAAISEITAPFSALIIGLAGVVSLVVSLIWFRPYIKLDFVSGLAGSITYLLYGLPVIAYGHPSWAGWYRLDDTATFLAVTDRLINVGRTVPPVISSSYDRYLQSIFVGANGGHFSYPIGSFIPFGVTSKLTGLDLAWLYQPYLAFSAGLTAMFFVVILREHVSKKISLVVISSISVMSSTLYTYAMWGSIKEMVLLPPLALFGWSVFKTLRNPAEKSFFVLSALTFIAMIFIGGTASLGFLGTIIFIALLIRTWSRKRTTFYSLLGFFFAFGAALTFFIRSGNTFFANLLIPIIGDNGNLTSPLSLFRIMGVWPTQDVLLAPGFGHIVYLFIAIGFFFTLCGLYLSIKKGQWIVPGLVIASTAVVANAHFWGGIWLTGKAMAIASPFFVLLASVGAYELWREVRKSNNPLLQWVNRSYAVPILGLIFGMGVLVSDSYTYKNVALAPYRQTQDLKTIGELFAGQGPALMTEYSDFGPEYFLRKLDAEGVGLLRVRSLAMRDGTIPAQGASAGIDLFTNKTIDYFNLLVLRKSPIGSRPPMNYRLVWSGERFTVWKKTGIGVVIKDTLPLGTNFSPYRVPTCDEVSNFLSKRSDGDIVFTAYRDPVYLVDFAKGDLPSKWRPIVPYTAGIAKYGPGGFARDISVPESRNYDISIAGTFYGRMRLDIDGVQVYSGSTIIELNSFLAVHLKKIYLSAGAHVLSVVVDSPTLMPGTDTPSVLGPIFISTQFAGDVKVERVSESQVNQLCKRNLDWIAIARKK
ncbi:MAG: hypothetical protein HY050_09745 [Actinobacteria bacterium]|nr:hypothetical protein [Actinomycetota bacterium]